MLTIEKQNATLNPALTDTPTVHQPKLLDRMRAAIRKLGHLIGPELFQRNADLCRRLDSVSDQGAGILLDRALDGTLLVVQE